MHPVIPRPHASMGHRYISLPLSIQNSIPYSCTSQTFMLQGFHTGPTLMMPHTGPTLVMLWGGSLTTGLPLTWLPLAEYGPQPPPVDHTGQSSSTPPPPSGQGYRPSLLWAPPARGQALPWGMTPWMTPTPQSHRPSSSPPMVSHLCLLSIVPFVIRANVELLAYSSIYIFKCPSSAGRDFIDTY
jgi:hypothetical protein